MTQPLDRLAQQMWMRAAETAEPPVVAPAAARVAGRQAWHHLGQQATLPDWLAERAAQAMAQLGGGASQAATAWGAGPRMAWQLGGVLVIVAFVSGLASPGIGPDGRLNLLAPPLWGLLAWNLAVYLALLLSWRGRAGAVAAGAPLGGLPRALLRVVEAWSHRASRRGAGASAAGPQRAVWARAWTDLAALLRPALGQMLAAGLHAAAAALALGGVAGLYLRGLATAFVAGWDSTFVSAGGAHALLHGVLGPASAVTGWPLPTVDHLTTLRFAAGPGEPAAPWVHLLALTVLAGVVLPRLLLAGAAAWRARRALAACQLPLDDGYGNALRREWLVQRAHVPDAAARLWLQPLQFSLSASQAAALPGWMTDRLPLPWAVHLAASLPVGADLPAGWVSQWRDASGQAPQALALLASLTATPERDTHGRCIGALLAQARAAGLPGPDALAASAGLTGAPDAAARAPVWLLVEAAAFGQRFGAARRAEREAAWRALVADLPLKLVFIDLAESP